MAHFSFDIAHEFASPGAHVAADSEEVAPTNPPRHLPAPRHGFSRLLKGGRRDVRTRRWFINLLS